MSELTKILNGLPIIGTLNVDTNKFTPAQPGETLASAAARLKAESKSTARPFKLEAYGERVLAGAAYAGFAMAYGYIGGMGHFIPEVVCQAPTGAVDEFLTARYDVKAFCDEAGVWGFATCPAS